MAELGRILTMMHGAQAPTESSLKKWSSAGIFADCLVEFEPEEAPLPASQTRTFLQRRTRAGRPGLCLDTRLAIQRVHAQWPHLPRADMHAVLELAVAKTADNLQAAVMRLVPDGPLAPTPSVADESLAASNATLRKIEDQLDALHGELISVKRELAQFSALRNNLITRLDEAVARAQEALAGGSNGGTGPDPLVEARRDRDMGVLKSMMSEMLQALERIEEHDRSSRGA